MSEQKYTTYITEKVGALPFCPGCGHTSIIHALDKALVKLQREPQDVVIVTDIGCIGLSDRHFTTSGFHGLHGRSITYACGLKLARPELTVIAIKGDGACGIGGTHLLNVARRNIGITLIIANNFNYGMTGGQHSVTTPGEGLTSTTPWGNPEQPMDLCKTAIAAGGSWVYRATSFDKDLPDVLASAIEQPGFAMLDILELCAAYYMKRNKFGKKELMALMEGYGYQHGLLVDKPRLEYSARYREMYEKGKHVLQTTSPIEIKFSNSVNKQIGIIIAGSAGQKIRSTARLFAEGAICAGLQCTQKDDYPITVQTGHSISEVILSPERIDYTGISSPDYFLLISEDGLKRAKAQIMNLGENCHLYADEKIELPPTKAIVHKMPFAKIGEETSKLSIAFAALGALIEDTGLFPIDAFVEAIKNGQKSEIANISIATLHAGAKAQAN
jgi:2-oxoglutarate ferredoxin oxidoreductase subunit beta